MALTSHEPYFFISLNRCNLNLPLNKTEVAHFSKIFQLLYNDRLMLPNKLNLELTIGLKSKIILFFQVKLYFFLFSVQNVCIGLKALTKLQSFKIQGNLSD